MEIYERLRCIKETTGTAAVEASDNANAYLRQWLYRQKYQIRLQASLDARQDVAGTTPLVLEKKLLLEELGVDTAAAGGEQPPATDPPPEWVGMCGRLRAIKEESGSASVEVSDSANNDLRKWSYSHRYSTRSGMTTGNGTLSSGWEEKRRRLENLGVDFASMVPRHNPSTDPDDGEGQQRTDQQQEGGSDDESKLAAVTEEAKDGAFHQGYQYALPVGTSTLLSPPVQNIAMSTDFSTGNETLNPKIIMEKEWRNNLLELAAYLCDRDQIVKFNAYLLSLDESNAVLHLQADNRELVATCDIRAIPMAAQDAFRSKLTKQRQGGLYYLEKKSIKRCVGSTVRSGALHSQWRPSDHRKQRGISYGGPCL